MRILIEELQYLLQWNDWYDMTSWSPFWGICHPALNPVCSYSAASHSECVK